MVILVTLTACIRAPQQESHQECEGCHSEPRSSSSFVVFGDYPYSAEQVRQLPRVVSQINQDAQVEYVFHLGDIKGAGRCSQRYYRDVKRMFDAFSDPLVYTFGDNEWADCSRPGNGGFNPLDRLAKLRKIFVPHPGRTLGRSVPVTCQADAGFPENVHFTVSDASIGVFHAVGSANGLAPWAGRSRPTAAQGQEVQRRSAAAVGLIQQTFADARRDRTSAVILMTQADMFVPVSKYDAAEYPYRAIVRAIAQESANFSGDVYLFNGDSHSYVSDFPLDEKSPWPSRLGVRPVENLNRVTVDGAQDADSYLKVIILPYSRPTLSWVKVPFSD